MSEQGLKVLTRVGLGDHSDSFDGLLTPYCADLEALSRLEVAIGVLGVLLGLAGFKPPLVASVVKQLIREPEASLQQPFSILALDGIRLFVPSATGAVVYAIATGKPMEGAPVAEPITVTSFSLHRIYQLTDVLEKPARAV
jgi:hypothetical protein